VFQARAIPVPPTLVDGTARDLDLHADLPDGRRAVTSSKRRSRMPIAGCYARKSTEQNVEADAKSVARQVQRAREFAKARGWTFDEQHIYSDDAVSGATLSRPGLNKMLAALTPKAPFDMLIVMASSRLSRADS